jgi:hypothetical protein
MPKDDDNDQREYVSRTDYERLRGDLEATQAALEEAINRGDEAEARVAELEPFEGRLKETEGKLRGTVHRAQFDKEATKLGIPDDLAEDIWDGLQSKGGYKTDSDEVKADAMREALVKYVEARPSVKGLLKSAGGEKATEGKPPKEAKAKLTTGDDAGRGGEVRAPGKLVISRSRFKNDREYTKQMQKPYAAAMSAGADNVQFVD